MLAVHKACAVFVEVIASLMKDGQLQDVASVVA
jgi:hypothetical protein